MAPGSLPRRLKEELLGWRRPAGMTQVTARLTASSHARFAAVWEALVQAAINAFPGQSASTCYAVVSVEDGEKQSLFESLGFRTTGPGEEFDLDGRRVASIRMDRMTA